ncbi:hypothetical protein GCM10022395_09050 [Snuella lapsa]|uniref:Cytochrome c domain-containing protein n=2 Tax=Snuella lapsa TaxID=870481 RepID=A0ABP6X507_9FLAO
MYILKINGITEFNPNNPKYEPLVSKDDKRTPEFEKGLNIFLNDCEKCHVTKGNLHDYLEGIVDKVGINYLKLYLTKQDSLIENKNPYALALKDNWGNQPNSHNFAYSTNELNLLIEYLK